MRTIKFYVIITLVSSSFSSFAQSISPAPGNSTICPDEVKNYEVRHRGYTNCGIYTWTLTNGTFTYGQSVTTKTTSEREVDVYWNDVAGNGTLSVTSNCSEGTMEVSKTYAIRSLKGRNITNPYALQNLPYCSTNSVYLHVDIMFLLNTGGSTGITQQQADGYEWVLPTGWSSGTSSGTVSTEAEFITITPDNGCRGGNVTVKAYVECSSGRKYSNSAIIDVSRDFDDDLTVPSGYTGPKCGVENPVTFTAADLSCATSYRWTATGTGWKDATGASGPWTTATNSIALTPTGTSTDDGVISVDINVGCKTVTQTYDANYTDPVPPNPSISKNNSYTEICNGDSWTFTCTPPSGYPTNFGFDWYATGGLKINGVSTSVSSPLHTTSNTVTVTAPSGAYGTAYIYARINNNACTPSGYVHLQTQAGPYSSSQFSISGPTTVCPNNTASYLSTLIDPSITNYQWGWSGFTYQSGQGTPYLGVYAPYNFSSGSITLRLQNRCGLTGSPAYKIVYSGYCGYGYTVNPNPAFTELTIEIESSENQVGLFQSDEKNTVLLVLTDESGFIVKQKQLKKKKEKIDISQLKPDIYYLKILVNDRQIDKTKRIVKK